MRKLAVVTLLALMLAACTRAEVSVVKYDCIRVVAEKEYQTRILGLFPYPSISSTRHVYFFLKNSVYENWY